MSPLNFSSVGITISFSWRRSLRVAAVISSTSPSCDAFKQSLQWLPVDAPTRRNNVAEDAEQEVQQRLKNKNPLPPLTGCSRLLPSGNMTAAKTLVI